MENNNETEVDYITVGEVIDALMKLPRHYEVRLVNHHESARAGGSVVCTENLTNITLYDEDVDRPFVALG